MDILLALLGAGSAGSFLAIGSAANARLRSTIHSSIAAATINFGVGFCILTLLLVLGILQPFSLDKIAGTPWWAFLGGLLGAGFVTLNTLIIPKLGLTTTTLAVVFSQMVMSLIVDQLGWFGIIPHALTIPKLLGIGLLFVAILLSQSSRHESPKVSS